MVAVGRTEIHLCLQWMQMTSLAMCGIWDSMVSVFAIRLVLGVYNGAKLGVYAALGKPPDASEIPVVDTLAVALSEKLGNILPRHTLLVDTAGKHLNLMSGGLATLLPVKLYGLVNERSEAVLTGNVTKPAQILATHTL